MVWRNTPSSVNRYCREYRRRKPEKYLVRGCRVHAKKYGRVCTITEKDIRIPKRCPILNVPLVVGTMHAPSVDRIDNRKGYVPGNVAVISRKANVFKGDMSLAQARRLVRYMERG